ncbi:MAG: hypothetical protein ACTSYW_00460 [Candidatus Heimdallarchaeota archaeon]
MKNYVGTKIIKAEPMNELAFLSKIKNETPPKNQEDRDGYHVQYPNPGGKIYNSWSPKEVFEQSYRVISINELTFLTDSLKFYIDGVKVIE